MAENTEPDSFLAGLDAKITALQQLRESYAAALSVGAVGQGAIDMSVLTQPASTAGGTSDQPAPSGPIELPTGVFRTTGLADAIRMYLSIAKRKQTIKQIATALQEGGLATTAGNFEQTLSASLYRLKNGGELLKFKDGWDLAGAYPESYRQRISQNSEATPKRKRKAKRKARAARKQARKQEPKKQEADDTDESAPVLRAI